MTLSPGVRIGPYEVVSAIGRGGMGEVYRARDRRLDRDVALKVLPQDVAADPERLARFDREAKTLASLNHPHIAQIYGLESGPMEAGPAGHHVRALVMELVEGETLAELLAGGSKDPPLRVPQSPDRRGGSSDPPEGRAPQLPDHGRAIPLDNALRIARQIAAALEAAHGRGIVHRDLKPANIKITPAGDVKVLDFGLAKLAADHALDDRVHGSSLAPTMTSPALVTGAGVLLGTAAYMSPEQARGKAVDKRADIWAFGVVVFEMLSGVRAFTGDSVTEVAAAVIHKEPDWNAVPLGTPARVRLVVRRCLEKDAGQRLHDMGDVRLALDGAFEPPQTDPSRAASVVPVWRRALPWAIAGIAALAWAVTVWRTPSAPLNPVVRLKASLGPGASLTTHVPFALSRDGSQFAFSAVELDGRAGQEKAVIPRLSVRRLDEREPRVLPGTEGGTSPFFSPDGDWLGFERGGKLWKVSVQSGAPTPLCDAAAARGTSWGADGFIVVAPDRLGGLARCPENGGALETLTKLDTAAGEISHRWPQALPGAVVFTSTKTANTPDQNVIMAQSLASGERKVLWRGGTMGRYLPTGHLVFVSQRALHAAPMDLEKLELTGAPQPVMQGVYVPVGSDPAMFVVSESGTLVFGGEDLDPNTSTSVLRLEPGTGRVRPILATNDRFGSFKFSPDGARAAFELGQGTGDDVWVYDVASERRSRLTFSTFVMRGHLAWAPSGQHIFFVDRTARRDGIAAVRADGAGEVVRLIDQRGAVSRLEVSPDGTRLVFSEVSTGTDNSASDLWVLPIDLTGPAPKAMGPPEKFLATPFNEGWARFSPDGKWLAYQSDESGALEVYVRPFPGPGGKTQVSNGGGGNPIWSPDGRHIYYQRDQLMRVAYTASGSTFSADKPQALSDLKFDGTVQELSRDAKSLIIVGASETGRSSPIEVTFVLNFFEEIRRRLRP